MVLGQKLAILNCDLHAYIMSAAFRSWNSLHPADRRTVYREIELRSFSVMVPGAFIRDIFF